MIGIHLASVATSVSLLAPAAASAQQPLACTYEVQRTFQHDPAAFTQGLIYHGGHFYESTGLVGSSTVRRVRIEDGQVVKSTSIPEPHFGEGLTKWKSELVSLTWHGGKGFKWDAATLRKKSEFSYSGEGWGLTQDGRHLILSDGTPVLRFLHPVTMKVVRTLTVTSGGQPVMNLNELEWVAGEIYANVWMTDRIVRIDPKSGLVKAVIDITGLRQLAGARGKDAVPNGIAHDPRTGRLFVTGKNWSKVFQIKVRGC